MASIVKRGSSYSVVYMTTIQGQRKQKWETYHSLDEAEQRKQISALLQQCKEPWLSLAINLAFAGTFRKGEMLALTWQDVDWRNRSIRISKTIKRVSQEALQALNYQDVLYEFPSVLSSGKTSLILKTPKTASSIREVYLPETLITILYEFYQSRKQVNTLSVFPDLIFCYEDGRPIQKTTLTKHFRTALERAGLPRVPFHSLRHSSITYKLSLSGGDIKAVQGDSGHAQADMITERYGHILEENRRNTSRRFEELFYQKTDC